MASGTDTRRKILDAAERVFSRHGFAGASMRMISAEADVSQALLHYHFHSKQLLYNDVFERRATETTSYRGDKIEQLLAGKPRPSLEELIPILYATPPEWQEDDQPGFYFTPIVSALSIGEDERSKEMMTRLYDPFARQFIEALKIVVPEFDHRHAVMAYMFALGIRLQIFARNGRIDRLCGKGQEVGQAELNQQAVEFAIAGVRSLADGMGSGTTAAKSA